MKGFILTCIFALGFMLSARQASATDIITDSFLLHHLKQSVYAIDTGADAVILYEKQSCRIISRNSVLTRRVTVRRVVKILRDSAIGLGKVSVICYAGMPATASGITYNLVNDTLSVTALQRADFLKADMKNGVSVLMFKLKNIKAGSILDYTYEQDISGNEQLFTWQIDDDYPKLTAEYSIVHPGFIQFTPVYLPALPVVRYKTEQEALAAADGYTNASFSDGSGDNTDCWVRHNVPAFRREPYLVNSHNYREVQELYMGGVLGTSSGSWADLNEYWWHKQGLGYELQDDNLFFVFTLDSLVRNSVSDRDKATAIFRFVRDRFVVNDKESTRGLKEVWTRRKGNKFTVNKMLLAMLLKARLPASAIAMSTTSVMSPNAKIPITERINYLACMVQLGDEQLLLDAADKGCMAGMLAPECYNGYAWILGDTGRGTILTPDMLRDRDVYSVKVMGFKYGRAIVEVQRKLGNVVSAELRRAIRNNKDARKNFLSAMQRRFPKGVEIDEVNMAYVDKPDTNIVIKMNGSWRMDSMDVMKMSLAFAGNFKENPFTRTERKLPVEFEYRSEYADYMTIELPDDFVPDTVLGPVEQEYDSGALSYKRSMAYMPELKTITVSSVFTMNRTKFDPAEYSVVKDFFSNIVADNPGAVVCRRRREK